MAQTSNRRTPAQAWALRRACQLEEFSGDLERLFAIHGVGPETVDSMLLYAGGHHCFVLVYRPRRGRSADLGVRGFWGGF